MARYFTRPRAAAWIEDEHYSPDPGPLKVPCVPDHEARSTGVLDIRGDEIWCALRPIGFGRDEDW